MNNTNAPIRLRPECALNNLTPEQQEQLFDWLETLPLRRVLEMVAADPPDGFGLKTHLTTLRRFHLRARARFHQQLTEDLPELGQATPANDDLIFASLQRAAAELSTNQLTPGRFTAAARWALRLREMQQREREMALMERRLALETRKFEFNAARQAIIHQQEIATICSNTSTDNEDKIWAAREKIFGPRSDLIEPPHRPESSHLFAP
ncbi:MAG TPA: hypothetical protein VEH27_05075 [Methylomirabilota bacterium]|nr:hypothetical protein [Methylomirabilota bacterium]